MQSSPISSFFQSVNSESIVIVEIITAFIKMASIKMNIMLEFKGWECENV